MPDRTCLRFGRVTHDEVLRTAIEGHDAYLFSHTGDGVVAAITSPKSAVDAAISAQRALDLPVRMGLAALAGLHAWEGRVVGVGWDSCVCGICTG